MSVNFPQVEEETLRFWDNVDAFGTQLELTANGPRFSFYDGPPFATGLPHYGHLLTSTIKDIIPRYWSMKGYHVVRRFGWDTHGVPVEYEIDKKLGMSGRDAVNQMGIAKYNDECRAIVMRYATDWRATIRRLGRWIDMDNDYKAMDPAFMETEWWVFKQLFDKGLVYRSYQVMPYSTALCTPLSFMESKQDERVTQDPAIVVAFPVLGQPEHADAALVAYTTTPWTLPSNLFIAVKEDFEYLKILDEATGKQYVTMEAGLSYLYKDPKKAKYKVLAKIRGAQMIGWKYKPMYPYFEKEFADCFQVIAADYIEAEEGTGLVPLAPAFGQEDFDACTAAGFISPTRLPPCPVDAAGCFTAEISDYVGQHVKAADKVILRDLRKTDRLVHESQIMHSDKFCWRSGTQLIRRAVSSWFVKVTDAVPTMRENLEATSWVPSFVKEKRFANWVSGAHDWNVSRNRYWGTPIPIWASDDYQELVCVGSVEELKRLSGYKGDITDLHRENIDQITIPSQHGKGDLHRVEEVLDCWFDSGCMPYASVHYPFENAQHFNNGHFPADFIAEGLDQTRGWFYTLTVLSNLLFEKSPFKNVLVNGMVLAEDGKKMSKSLKNYPDPKRIFDEYGSDALRLYLISSPVVKAEPMRFKEAGVKEIVSRVLLPLWNSYRFFSEQAKLYEANFGRKLAPRTNLQMTDLPNIMDRWVLSNCQSLLKFIEQEMAAYRLYTVVPRLLQMIDNLTNWYIRFNRKRLKGTAGFGEQDNITSLSTLLEVLFTLVKALAPFTPFVTEHIYGLLKPHLTESLSQYKDSRSVHFLPFPAIKHELVDEEAETKMALLQKVIQQGRVARERRGLLNLWRYIQDELNVRDVHFTANEEEYGIQLEAKVDWPTLGKRLKKDVQLVRNGLSELTQVQLQEFRLGRSMIIKGIKLDSTDVAITRVMRHDASAAAADGNRWEAAFGDDLVVLLDTSEHPELVKEGFSRELVNRVQRLRKQARLVPTDNVRMEYVVVSNPDEVPVDEAVLASSELFLNSLRGNLFKATGEVKTDGLQKQAIVEQEQDINGVTLRLSLFEL